MKNYNTYLSLLRKEKGLSIKEAAKKIGINRFKLYYYENGYFRPNKKDLEKINHFYETDISLKGEDAYPAPIKEKALKRHKEVLLGKRIAFGVLSLLSLLSIAAGAILFNQSVNNTTSYYGETYNEMKKLVIEEGEYGYDLVTSMKYYYLQGEDEDYNASIIFYQSNNILYFNECTYSKTVSPRFGAINRYHYDFGSNLGVNSFRCDFAYGSVESGTSFTCSFDYKGGQTDHIYNLKILVPGTEEINEEIAIEKVNSQIDGLDNALSTLFSEYLQRKVDFYEDFLPDREQGRAINFALQITGLILLFSGIIAFYIFFGIFIKAMIANIKPRLVTTDPLDQNNKHKPLPEDITIKAGIPDVFIVFIGKFFQYGSMLLFFVAFIARLGVPFLSAFSNPILLKIFNFSWLAGIFLEQFVMIGRIKKPTTLFHEIIYNIGIFLFVATIETVLISITNAWGYDLAGLIYKYVPGNVYQVVAFHYLIFLFLFFQPSFLNKRGKWVRILWHSLSIIPLGFLVTAYVMSNSYALVYGVRENIFINFWFPNGFLSLSIVSVLFLYATFFLRLYYERKYGRHNAQFFFFGDRYTLYENAICAILIIIAASVDFVFIHNQYAYYLGLGGNYWMYALIPFIMLCKYSPNNQQVFLLDEGFTRLIEEEKKETISE